MAGFVGDIPAEGIEERIEELPAQLGFVVPLALVGVAVLFEPGNKFQEYRRCLTHGEIPVFLLVGVAAEGYAYRSEKSPVRARGKWIASRR